MRLKSPCLAGLLAAVAMVAQASSPSPSSAARGATPLPPPVTAAEHAALVQPVAAEGLVVAGLEVNATALPPANAAAEKDQLPPPGSIALAIAGLAAVGFIAGRRRGP